MVHVPMLSVEKMKRTGSFDMDFSHMHDTYEIYYLLSGERFYYIHDRVYALQAGDVVFIHKNQLHRTTSKGRNPHERILINFDDASVRPFVEMGPGQLPLFGGESYLLRPSVQEQGRIADLLFLMLREEKEGQLWRMPYLQTLLIQLLILLSRIREGKAEPVKPEFTELQQRVYRIVEYLNGHYAGPLRLEEIAERFFISTTYLCRIFKQTTGFTVVEYLTYVRVREAQALLVRTDWKITKIAEEAGFDSIAHFGRVFKKITGRSPLQYRKQKKAEPAKA
ncbi:AraC family transcriptional regulator [Paenibacillus sp. alder61]|uniref:helix-turn-helix transcriptional regulator n=1 Tax=Paenibacillus sp. alder61 TaxID=2862948 RepID=UPI001CD641B0|nr:AraC family transcriptional regulator [Paenibacillus sp. alder61]MCA1292934.1 AraC family transcriptional regulator [Paenibacillus sp. alder61]